MTPATLYIVLPLPPRNLSPNRAPMTPAGRMAHAAAAKKYKRLAVDQVERAGITTTWPAAEARAAFYFKTKGRRDPDNYAAMLKYVWDGIVTAGLLTDDDYTRLTRHAPDFYVDKDAPRIEITLTETRPRKWQNQST